MITILAAACLAVPQDARLDRIPFQPSSPGSAALGGLVSEAPTSLRQDGAFLGVGLGSEGEARIATVAPRSAAAIGGLEVGDVILSIEGTTIGEGADVSAALALRAPGESVTIVVRRGGEELTRDVVLGRRPQAASSSAPAIGLELEPNTTAPTAPEEALSPRRIRVAPLELQRPGPGFLGIMATPSDVGVAIEGVNPGGPAEGAGLMQGDVLLEVDGRSIGSVDELVATLGELGAGRGVEVLILRDGQEQRVPVVLGARPGNRESGELDRLERVPTPDLFRGDMPGLQLFGDDFLIVEDDESAGGSNIGGRATDEQREMMREFRTRVQELRDRHLAEMDELRAEMDEMFEAHGIPPHIQRLRDRRAPAVGDLFGGDLRQRFRFFDDGELFDIEVPQDGAAPRIQLRRGALGVPPPPADPAAPGQPRMQFHGGLPGSQGQQQIIEVEVLPDGKRIERRRRAELHDGEWKWVEETVDELPPGAPRPDGGAGHDDELQRTLEELRAQIDQLEKRAAELRARHGGR